MEWPRIPLPGWPDGVATGAADALAESATRGRELAALLGSDTPVPTESPAAGFQGRLRGKSCAIISSRNYRWANQMDKE